MKFPRHFLSMFAPAVIVLLAAVAYYPGIQGEFVFDDIGLIQSDPFYTDSDVNFTECWSRSYWNGSNIGQYRPLTVASFWLNSKVAGMNSTAFRIINLLLHVGVTLLVLKLANALRLGHITAWLAAMLYAVHPLLSEAIIPATGRAELLCLFFILGGLIFYIKFGFPVIFTMQQDTRVKINPLTTVNGHVVRVLIPGIFLVFACWSKENGIILLPLCILYDILYRSLLKFPGGFKWVMNTAKRFLAPYAVFGLMLVIVAFYRISGVGVLFPMVHKNTHWIDNPLVTASSGVRIVTALKVQGMICAKFFWPEMLSHDYSYAQILPSAQFADFYVCLAVFMLLIFPIILCLLLPKKKKVIIFMALSYIISILPAGNFFIPTGTILGERTFYTPLVWLTLLTVYATVRMSRKFRYTLAVSVSLLLIAVLASIGRVWARTEDWDSQMGLALKGIETAPKSIKTWNNLAVHFAHIEEYDKAVAACNIALKIYPKYQQALCNRAYYYIAMDNFPMAEKDFRQLVRLGSRDPDIFNKLGAILASTSQKPEAEIMWKHSLTINPYQPEIKKALQKLRREMSATQIK